MSKIAKNGNFKLCNNIVIASLDYFKIATVISSNNVKDCHH